MIIGLSYFAEVRTWAEKLVPHRRMKPVCNIPALGICSAARTRERTRSLHTSGQEETKWAPRLCFSPHAVPRSAYLFWKSKIAWCKGRWQKQTLAAKLMTISHTFALGDSDVCVRWRSLSFGSSEGRGLSPLLSFLSEIFKNPNISEMQIFKSSSNWPMDQKAIGERLSGRQADAAPSAQAACNSPNLLQWFNLKCPPLDSQSCLFWLPLHRRSIHGCFRQLQTHHSALLIEGKQQLTSEAI